MNGSRRRRTLTGAPRGERSLETVLRLLDARTGSRAAVKPARPGLLRVCAHVPGPAGKSTITGLRVLLAADLLFRAAELEKLQVLTALASDGGSSEELDALARPADALGIHPPAARVSAQEAEAGLGGPVDVHVMPHDTRGESRQGGVVIAVGSVHMPGTTGQDVVAGLADPLAVRLALMTSPIDEQADLADDALAGAGKTLTDWRRRVAEWAQSPSRPVPASLADAVRAAVGDLDAASVITLIRDLSADNGVPAGARFETFLYADRLLGLELPRDIGRLAV